MQASDNEGHTDFTGSSETDSDDENTSTPAPPVQFIQDRGKRRSKFKRRKEELMAKSYELATLTGTQVLTLAVSETGLVYTFTTPRLQPLVTTPEGKNLIQKCLNAPHPTTVPGAPSSADAAPTPLQPDNTMEGTSRQQTIGMGSMDMREGSTEPVLTPEHRAKFAQKETSSEKKYIRDSRFWMADGNIILSVPDLSSTSAVPRFFLYRVHKSALARHSEVFEHMFSFSASPDSEGAVNEMYDGLPVVDMPDSKKHIDSLLEVLYEPW
ncbi:hypothetical protein DFH11DRAFT_1613771 [Phellopilus nigrolimitatus]|nr:hypothetical protein DFH11DRAFT_1613771 [Phellopilus nigrolimitatus]